MNLLQEMSHLPCYIQYAKSNLKELILLALKFLRDDLNPLLLLADCDKGRGSTVKSKPGACVNVRRA